MNRHELLELIKRKKSFLCVGLDPELSKLPKHLLNHEDPVFEFNRRIVDATISYAVAYKPNLAFYETTGVKGWISLEKTIQYIKSLNDEVFIIADAKRGDIGNTSARYAEAFFDKDKGLDVDAVTVAPYMGEDSVSPFLGFPGKWVILLALTSNKGALDFQMLDTTDRTGGEELKMFEKVLKVASSWGNTDNMMFVVGATQAEMLSDIRRIVPHHFLLVPGVGAQGGSLKEVVKYGMNTYCGLLINASRSILYASSGEDFETKAGEEAKKLRDEMQFHLMANGFTH